MPEQTLYGNLVICRSHEGNFTDLTDEDIQEIENNTYIRQDFMDNIQLPVLVYSYGEIEMKKFVDHRTGEEYSGDVDELIFIKDLGLYVWAGDFDWR